MTFDPSAFNPANAVERERENFTNIARCTVNKVVTSREAFTNQKTGTFTETQGTSADDPVWVLEYEALDAQFPDGNKMKIFNTMKLLESTDAFAKRQSKNPSATRQFVDSGQRAPLVAKAFAGHGISVYPLDPAYDESKVIGNVFVLEMIEQKNRDGERLGRPYPVPQTVLGPAFIYTGKVRTITPKGSASVSSNGATAGAPAPVARDIATDETLRSAIAAALVGVEPSDSDAISAAIKTVTPLAGLQIAGKAVGGLIVSDAIGAELSAAGII